MKRWIVLIGTCLSLSACDLGLVQMGASEFGVIFRRLPPVLGGGLSHKIVPRGTAAVVWPWDVVYRLDTKIKRIEWGPKPGGEKGEGDWIQTRALDGNEVSLAVVLQYHLAEDSAKLVNLLETVATDEEAIDDLVNSVARSEVRTQLNKLRTHQFKDEKYKGQTEVENAMRERLGPYGIEVDSVNIGTHHFWQIKSDGTIDTEYEDRINEAQTYVELTEREKVRKNTVIADKQREYNDMQAKVNRRVQESQGYLSQAKLRGEGYFASRKNEAEGILASGQAEVQGIQEQVNALGGPGGRAILKLELAKKLQETDPKFILLEKSGGSGQLDVNRTDMNELLNQVGVMEALKEKTAPVIKEEKQ